MAKNANQKLKILFLAQILHQQTDQEHPLSAQQLIKLLAQQGIMVERRTIYEDISMLKQFGMDIITVRKVQNQYYLGERDFQLAELKLLVDSVLSTKFITIPKSRQLIQKISALGSNYQAKTLQRQVHVQGRAKTINEKIYYTVDTLQTALEENKQIQFKYAQWKIDSKAPNNKKKEYRHNGKEYKISPWALLWDNEKYYTIAYDAKAKQIRHYRADKMEFLEIVQEKREGKERFEAIDMSRYTQTVFGMFGGEKIEIELQFANHLLDVVLDKFGNDITIYNVKEKTFCIEIEAVPSVQFIGWLVGLGLHVQVISPLSLRRQIRQELTNILGLYDENENFS